MSKRIFDQDPLTGITRYWHMRENGEFVIETQQDVSKIADQNRRIYNETPDRHGDMPRVASIPLPIYYDLKRRGIIDDQKKFKQWLNDSDQRAFRTWDTIL